MRGELKENNRLNVTLSLDITLFNELKRESELSNGSINSKINTILTKHVRFYRIMEEIGRDVIPQEVFDSMLGIMDEEKLCKIMENHINTTIYSIFTHNGIPLSLDNIESHFFQQFGLWSGMYSAFHSYTDLDKTISLTFEHKHGIKWSRALGRMFSAAIKNFLGAETDYEIMGNTVKIMIREVTDKSYIQKKSILERVPA